MDSAGNRTANHVDVAPSRTADEVVRADLDRILAGAAAELADMAGKRLLITGCAGFLSNYLIQAVLR